MCRYTDVIVDIYEELMLYISPPLLHCTVTFYWSACQYNERERSYMCVRGIDCASVSTILLLYFGTTSTMFFFIYCFSHAFIGN